MKLIDWSIIMKKIPKIVFLVALTMFSTSLLHATSLNKTCEMYQHANFKGAKYLVYAGAEVWFIGKAWNDQVSSIIVPSTCKLKVYLHHHFRGFDKTYNSGSYRYVGDSWNDNISSMKCTCK